jgi:hypothetical protein
MNASKTTIQLIILITFCHVIISCESVSYKEPLDTESIWVKVDSIKYPSEIISRVPFVMEFFGNIGNKGCYHSAGYIGSSSTNEYIIKIYANIIPQSRECSKMMDFRTYMAFPSEGIYNFKIKQPDNTFLVKQITVK